MGRVSETVVTVPGPPLPDRTVLRDPELDERLRRDGVVLVDLMPPEQVAEVARIVRGLYRGDTTGQHYTLLSTDFEYRRSVFDTVPGLFAEAADRVFDDYEFCAASLGFKWPGEDAVLGSHQDITLVDEQRFRSYCLWFPLVDTDEGNGAVRFLRGSHHVLDNIRTMPSGPRNFLHEAEDVPLEALEMIPTRLGQGLIFDHAVLHGSGPNLSDDLRPAVIVAYRPAEAELLHHFLPDLEGRDVQRFDAGGDFYPRQMVGQQPAGEPVEVVPFYGTPRKAEEIVAMSRAVSPPDIDVVAAGRGTVDSEPVGPEVERTFHDDDLQAHLDEFGYAVFDVLSPDQVAELRAVVDEIFPEEIDQGFHASNVADDPAYRRIVHERVGPTLEAALSPMLEDYVLCSTLSTMKFPDEGSGFVVHQDWKMVDERRFRGVNVWCPLVDTDPGNGGLLVLPGSHKLLDAVRCGPVFPRSYDGPGLRVTWDQMLPVPVRAGQALMFDHRLLHSSGPNRSAERRPAVVAVMVPAAAQLLHWYLPDPGEDRLEVLAVDRDFFCDFDRSARPDYPVVAEVPFVHDRITTEELIRSCGGPFDHAPAASAAGPEVPSDQEPAGVSHLPARRSAARRLASRARRRLSRR